MSDWDTHYDCGCQMGQCCEDCDAFPDDDDWDFDAMCDEAEEADDDDAE
jgi:hypothetical protein